LDVCGVDYLKAGDKPRFEVVYHLYSVTNNHRLRLRVKVPEEDMTLPTATDLWKSADWHEREAFDMFGFRFEGHPNLKRILLFDGFEGHPLRKDYPMEKRQKIPVPEEKPS
jgi:NADH-quinone oxidoreductase subunit C